MKIKLTADTRVLLSAGTIVDVSKETAAVIQKLGRCELVKEKAEKKADTVAKEEAPEADEAPKKKATKKKD